MSPDLLDLTQQSLDTKAGGVPSLEYPARVMSFNICWDKKEQCSNCWSSRKQIVASMIRFHRVDLVGLQEPYYDQMVDLEELLPEFGWYGVGLEDGQKKGLFDAIMYRKDRYKLLDKDSFFLSPTPQKPSKGWNAKYKRGVTWGFFEDLLTHRRFFFFNTHFDYHSKDARDGSAHLLRQKILELTQNELFIVTGDFNLFPELGGGDTYQMLTENCSEPDLAVMVDAQYTSKFPHHGPTGTWSGFIESGQPGIKPDCIFVHPNIDVLSHGILADTFDGNKYPSDHLPVVADLNL